MQDITFTSLIPTHGSNITRVCQSLLPQLQDVDVIISHQNVTEQTHIEDSNVTYLQADGAGASRNRNNLLANIKPNTICHFCDDDISYLPDFNELICQAYQDNPSADVITFQMLDTDGNLMKDYPQKKINHNKISVLKVGCPEITFKSDSILRAKIKFDEDFGFTKYTSGEDSIFVADCLKHKLNVLYIPIAIATHPIARNWDQFSTKTLHDKGAALCRVLDLSPTLIFLMLAFTVLKYKLYRSKISMFSCFTQMLKGAFDFHRYKKSN